MRLSSWWARPRSWPAPPAARPWWPCSARRPWPSRSAGPTPSSPSTTRRWPTTPPRRGRRPSWRSAPSASPGWCSSPTRPSGWTSARPCRPAGTPRWSPTPSGSRPSGSEIVATAQVYGGKLLAEVALTGDHGVCTVVAGSFPAAGAGAGSPAVEALAPPAGLDDLKTSFLTMVEPEGGDVDITAADVLVSVGRGIGSQDNVELLQELADAIGRAAVGVAAGDRLRLAPEDPPGGQVGPQGEAQGVPDLRHLRGARAPGGDARRRADHRLQHRRSGADLRRRPLRHDRSTCSTSCRP